MMNQIRYSLVGKALHKLIVKGHRSLFGNLRATVAPFDSRKASVAP